MEALLAVSFFNGSRKYSYLSPLQSNSWRGLCLSETKYSCHLVSQKIVCLWDHRVIPTGGHARDLQPNVLLKAGPTLRPDQGLCSVPGPWKPPRTEMPQLRATCACVTSCKCLFGSSKGLLSAVRKFGSLIQNMGKKLHPSVFVVYFLSFIYNIKWSWSGSSFGEENHMAFQTIKYCWIYYCLKIESWSGQREVLKCNVKWSPFGLR